MVGISVALWDMSQLSNQLIQIQARQNSELYAQVIQQARTLYSDIVEHAQLADCITATDKSMQEPSQMEAGELPLPVTFLLDLGERIKLENAQTQIRLYSPYPFEGRMGVRGIQDDFEQRAWDYLSQNPTQAFYEIAQTAMGQEYRYAKADVMKASCIECHHNHPDRPSIEWNVGDVRGVLKIVYPLEGVRQAVHRGLRKTFFVLLGLSLLAIAGIALVVNRLRHTSRELEERVIERTVELDTANHHLLLEQEKSKQLLLNILPPSVAEELKEGRSNIAKGYDHVTILFADIVEFTALSAKVPAIDLVQLLNRIFSEFDRLAEFYGLEKIKTIGDAYMVVGGLPTPNQNHATAIADMALAMQAAIAQFYTPQGKQLQIRVGINTGPVVAGVIGTKKFIYDLWGDTVNVASRMETSGEPGQIQLTTATYAYLKDHYALEERGLVSIKGKGNMFTYWLKGKELVKASI